MSQQYANSSSKELLDSQHESLHRRHFLIKKRDMAIKNSLVNEIEEITLQIKERQAQCDAICEALEQRSIQENYPSQPHHYTPNE